MLTALSAYTQATIGRFRSEDGAGIVEYVLLIVAIALLVLAAMYLLSGALNDTFSDISSDVSGA